MQYKTLIEKLRWSKNIDLDRQLMALNGNIRNYFRQEKCPDFYLKLHKGEKTDLQNKAFHSAVNQLLPQYNEYLANHGADRFGKLVYNKDSFKEALKVEAGYFREITKEEALIYVKMNRQELKRLLPDATVEELVEARLRQKEVGRIRDATKEQLIDILKAIEIWAMDKGFLLRIEKKKKDK